MGRRVRTAPTFARAAASVDRGRWILRKMTVCFGRRDSHSARGGRVSGQFGDDLLCWEGWKSAVLGRGFLTMKSMKGMKGEGGKRRRDLQPSTRRRVWAGERRALPAA